MKAFLQMHDIAAIAKRSVYGVGTTAALDALARSDGVVSPRRWRRFEVDFAAQRGTLRRIRNACDGISNEDAR